MRRLLLVILALGFAAPAMADPLTITKTATVITDPLGYTVTPRSLPGAVVDYKVLYQNPIGNLFKPVRSLVTDDVLPANVVLRVSDLAVAGKGPVEFLDGSLLGTGLLGSGLGLCPPARCRRIRPERPRDPGEHQHGRFCRRHPISAALPRKDPLNRAIRDPDLASGKRPISRARP